MDYTALNIVRTYITEQLTSSNNKIPDFNTYIVWKCKTLQNWKYLIATTLQDNMYYELTYNGDKVEWYLDVYTKTDNKVIID